MNIVEFLEARIAEDEAAVERRGYGAHFIHAADAYGTFNPRCPDCLGLPARERTLAECAAKRAIIDFHKSWPVLVQGPPDFSPQSMLGTTSEMAFSVSQRMAWLTEQEYRARFGTEPPTAPMIGALAAVYADHPDYREEWRHA